MQYGATYSSPLGTLTLASDGEALTGLWMEDQKYFGSGLGPLNFDMQIPVLEEAKAWLKNYFDGKCPDPKALVLNPEGTPFQQAVWQCLLEIPYGQVTTYGALAETVGQMLGRPTSARAVGAAVGRNPISIVIPCHRVVGAKGALTGYAGGLERKAALLKLEGWTGIEGRKL